MKLRVNYPTLTSQKNATLGWGTLAVPGGRARAPCDCLRLISQVPDPHPHVV